MGSRDGSSFPIGGRRSRIWSNNPDLRHELGFRIGLFLAAAPLASTFAGALAYGITSGHSKFANWRLLFLVEGIPTLVMAVVAYFFLPDSPGRAKFLTEEEKVIARARGVRQTGEGGDSHHGGLRLKDIGLTLIDAKAWFTAVRGLFVSFRPSI
jgi:hypothetical protein